MKRLSKSQIQGELAQARMLYGRGEVASALKRVDAILRTNPDSFEADFGKATLLLALDQKLEALDSFKAVLRYERNSRDALYWAAQIAVGLGRASEAEPLALRLTKLEPKDDRGWFLLSIAQSLSGKWLDAAESIDGALAVKPDDLNYLVGKAQLLVKLHVHTLAIDFYRRALAIEPAPQIAKELADVLLEEGQAAEALSLLERHASNIPDDPALQVLLARAFAEAGRTQEADTHWSNAKACFKSESEYVNSRARHEIASGRIQIAEDLLREGLHEKPTDIQLFALLAPIVKFSGGDIDQIGTVEEEINRSAHTALTRQTLAYALGKAYHDLEDYGKAMSYFDLANHLRAELTPNGLRFDRAEMTAKVDLQIRSFTAERISILKREGLESDLPIFVVGMIRSGTTLTEQILSCHSQIGAAGEVSFWVDHAYQVADPLGSTYDSARANRLGREYLKSLEASQSGRRFVVDKNPLNVLIAPTLHCIFPHSRIVHTKRHAVDNLLSIWMTPLTTGLQFITARDDLVFAYREYLRLARHMEDALPPETYRTFAYEELTSAPEQTIGDMLSFLGVQMEEACLHPEKNPRPVKTPSMYQVRSAINIGSQDRWKLYEAWLGPFADVVGM